MIYKLFGFPIWYGRIKTKVAKKHLDCAIKYFIKNCKEFENMGIGSLVNDCTGFNSRVQELSPKYYKVSNGFILYDISIKTGYGWCSLTSCGIELGKDCTREKIEKDTLDFIEWYFSSKEDLPEKILKEYTALKNGKHIVDEQGILLKEFSLR